MPKKLKQQLAEQLGNKGNLNKKKSAKEKFAQMLKNKK